MSGLLNIKDLRISAEIKDSLGVFQWKEIVHGIDIDLKRGEVLGLIGESGAGKSTLGLASMGYCRPGCKISGGSIIFDGIDIIQASNKEKESIRGKRIAYVAQSAAASFNPAHRIIDQFTETTTIHNVTSKSDAVNQAKDLYKRLLLPEPDQIGYRFPHQVSGGQLQRAMVAMALSCKPDLIIFDEPTTALDVTTQIEVLIAIKEVTRTLDTAAIYISHDLAVVAQIADRIMVLRYGNLVEENDSRKMLAEPKEDYTQKLLAVRKTIQKEKEIPDEAPLLQIKGITAGYVKGTNVVKNIDLELHKGRTVAVVGESGSGKSSLARVITGLLPPVEGEIIFDGSPLPASLKARDKESLRRIQMIYQMPDTAMNPKQKIHRILGRSLEFYFGMKRKQQKERVIELLEMVELPAEYYDRLPSELSGGEKQRVCIARALAANPELIICDEVTSALDQLVAEDILKLLHRLREQTGVCYLFITHDLSTVKAIADQIVVMLQGRIVEQGGRLEVLDPPYHEYTELLLKSVPEMDPDWLNNLIANKEQH